MADLWAINAFQAATSCMGMLQLRAGVSKTCSTGRAANGPWLPISCNHPFGPMSGHGAEDSLPCLTSLNGSIA